MTKPNTKHAAALEDTRARVEDLRINIAIQLRALARLADSLEDLVDTRQSVGMGFLTPEAAAVAAKAAISDRKAALGIATHTDRSFVAGLRWLAAGPNSGAGQHPAPATTPVLSAQAQIWATLKHHLRHMTRRTPVCPWPPIPREGTDPVGIRWLIQDLRILVDVYGVRPDLEALLADLDWCEDLAREVIDGPARTRHPDICPWCGRESLVIYHRVNNQPTQLIVCEGRHRCECDHSWCDCHTNPYKFRHEWTNSGRATHNWTTLARLQAAYKENKAMEAAAQTALGHIQALHHPSVAGDAVDEADVLEDPTAYLSVTCGICGTDWPCETWQVADDFDLPTSEDQEATDAGA